MRVMRLFGTCVLVFAIGAAVVPGHAAENAICEFTSTALFNPPPRTTPVSGTYTATGTATCTRGPSRVQTAFDSTGVFQNATCAGGSMIGTFTFPAVPASLYVGAAYHAGMGTMVVDGGLGIADGAFTLVPSGTPCSTNRFVMDGVLSFTY